MKKTTLVKTMLLLCALIVGSSNLWADETPEVSLDFTVNTEWGFPVGSGNGLTAEKSYSDGTYTIKLSASTKYYFNSDGYLMIGKSGSKLTLPAFSFDVEKIVVTGNSSASGDTKMNVYVGTTAVSTETKGSKGTNTYNIAEGYQTKGNIFIVQVTSNHNAQITKIDIYKKSTDENKVVTPTFDPVGGTYTSAKSVGINCGTAGATIHYTMTEDGTTPDDPTESDATYSAAISVTKSGTKIKAKAFKSDMTASSVASATYTIKPNAPTITGGANVTITGDDGLTFYYTTNGNAPTNSSTEYTGAFTPEDGVTVKAIAYDTYGNSSAVTTLKYKYMPLAPKNINSGYYVKVTNADELENGDAILIVNETGKVAMSTTQNSNNRAKEDVTISSSTISSPSANVQKLVLVKRSETIEDVATDVFYFYTGEGYLYAASSSSNHLKTEATPDDNNNARATISISSGNATITFTGKNTSNVLKYNSTNTIFSCYSSGQSVVQIYKEIQKEPVAPTTSGEETYLTTSDNMAGWRAFYDATQGYTLDANTKAYVATAKSGTDAVTLTTIDAVPAGTPVVLKTSAVDHKMTLTKGTPATYTGTNYLKVTEAGDAVDAYRLGYNSTDGVAFYPYAVASAPAGVIYLELPSGARALTFEFDDNTTAIEAVKTQKIANGEYFNLAGQRVAQPTKGLYIVNGKKVIIK